VALDHTPAEAMLLDLVLLALTLAGWIGTRGRPEKDARLGGWLVTAALILGIALPALFGFKMPEAGGPENSSIHIDLNNLQVRGPEPVSLTKGDFLVVLMDTDCGTCREKVPLLDRLSRKAGLPQVIGLFKNENDKIALFFEEFEPAFMTAQISEDDFWGLLGYGDIPRTLLIRDGTVIKVWDKAVPDEETVTGAM
jgi:hypothetical protein